MREGGSEGGMEGGIKENISKFSYSGEDPVAGMGSLDQPGLPPGDRLELLDQLLHLPGQTGLGQAGPSQLLHQAGAH